MNAQQPFASRAGLKLDHALRAFNLDVTGFVCADFGCNVGGFTDCLLQRGAAKVFAIDTGYGALAWKLRNDPRVVVMERTNALHAPPPQVQVDLVVIDLAWTPQRHAIPAALKWQRPFPPPCEGGGQGVAQAPVPSSSSRSEKPAESTPRDPPTPGPCVRERGVPRIITLVKPHYELDDDERRELLHDGRLDPVEADRVLQRVMEAMPAWGVEVVAHTRSPITGGKSSKGGAGNVEYLVMARRRA